MTRLEISTINNFGQNGLFARRVLNTGKRSAETPAVAHQPKKRRQFEDLHSDSRGICELYQTVGGNDLDRAMSRPSGGAVADKFEKQLKNVSEEEVRITFFEYDETITLPPAHAQFLAQVQAAFSDIITVPMHPRLVGDICEGLSDPAYRSLKKSIATFLHAVEACQIEKPVMGLIPRLGWSFIDDLLELYEGYDILAYGFDFDRCKVTTGTQVSMIGPLMQSIANRGIEEYVLFYALNPHPGFNDDIIGARPADDFASFGLGFDIIGGRHRTPNVSSEAAEEMESGELTFRLFDRESWVRQEVPLEELVDKFPQESAFDPQRIAARLRQGGSNAKYRFQTVVNAEQLALAAKDLRDDLDEGDAYQRIASKPGISPQAQRAYHSVRDSFDEAREQSGLGDFV